ncbi:MAG: sortase [Oscillospiraceae bacterium]|nr:sortase [Oscillospiraceae bacterium]
MKKAPKICFAVGITLLISALSLCVYNINEDKKGGEQAKTVLEEIKAEFPEPSETIPAEIKYDLFAEYETLSAPTEPVIQIDETIYIGVIAIPELEIELPVMNEWSYPNLKISPCRYQGSYLEDNMIIAAHNYRSHFGRIGELHSGSEILFTDASGKIWNYEVDNIQTVGGTDVDAMQFGSGEDWDLTLFTCTLSGQSRVTIRAVRKEAQT